MRETDGGGVDETDRSPIAYGGHVGGCQRWPRDTVGRKGFVTEGEGGWLWCSVAAAARGWWWLGFGCLSCGGLGVMATSWRIVEKLGDGSLCGLKFLLPTSDETLFKLKSISSSTSNNNNKDSASTSNCFQYLAKNLMVKLKSQSEKSGYMSMSAPCRSFPITDCEAQPTSLFVKWLKPRIPLVPSLLLLMMNRRKSALVFPCGHLFTSSSSSSEAAASSTAREAAARLRDQAVIARAREFVSP
ncbi:hypothetical protein Q3G72_000429 [Acer saccharum]|nr:hypothetical protein Q3G72_000429 [Acer saccharum]